MPLKNGRTTAAIQQILVGSVIPPGTIAPFAGGTVPSGWLLCDGSTASRSTYSALFAAVGTAHGSGDGSSTFNLPDYRGQFLRGRVNISTVTGSGTAASNQATFTSHGINRTGFRIRLSSGTLSGLAASTDYFAIVVDANTLAFASSQANALANTRIAISGANSAVITQWEDPDIDSRLASNVGGNSGDGVGSRQADAMQQITGSFTTKNNSGNRGLTNAAGIGAISTSGSTTDFGSGAAGGFRNSISFDSANSPNARTSTETRAKNSIVNYIIKF